MKNAELINELRYCFVTHMTAIPWYVWCDRAADALEAAEKRIDGLQKLVDINTKRCEALRKQLRELHESYEKHINEPKRKKNAVLNYEQTPINESDFNKLIVDLS